MLHTARSRIKGTFMIRLLTLGALTAILGLTSCNTAIGFGRDLRQLGTMMENKAYGRNANADQGNLPAY